MKLHWQLRIGLDGRDFLAAANCPYFIVLLQMAEGTMANVVDDEFMPIGDIVLVATAKKKVRKMLNITKKCPTCGK